MSIRHFGRVLFGRFSRSSQVVQSYNKSTLTDPVVSTSQLKSLSQIEISTFKNLLPELVEDLTYNGHHKSMLQVNEHLAKSILYNCTNGKLTRGFTVALTLKLLNKNDQLSDEKMREAYVLGWCVELLQAFFLVADDMMDGSTTRRGKECWYRKDDLGMLAINDAILLETCIYTLLDKYFRDTPYYLNLLDAFLYITRHTAMGQQLDLMSASCKLENFDMKRYSQIVQYKTCYYSFYLPVQLGMILADVKDPELYRQSRAILLDMGHLFQIQDDYLDCFGNPEVTGKIGTDIQDRKCSWLIVQAMEKANPHQKKILNEYYGKDDSEAVAKVKNIYDELQLENLYKTYEDEAYTEIINQINGLSSLNPDIFLSFLGKIYKRES